MAGNHKNKSKLDEAVSYQVRVQNHLNPEWAINFEDITLTQEETGNTLLNCSQLDQSGLYGLLKKIRDSGLLLISVERIEETRESS